MSKRIEILEKLLVLEKEKEAHLEQYRKSVKAMAERTDSGDVE